MLPRPDHVRVTVGPGGPGGRMTRMSLASSDAVTPRPETAGPPFPSYQQISSCWQLLQVDSASPTGRLTGVRTAGRTGCACWLIQGPILYTAYYTLQSVFAICVCSSRRMLPRWHAEGVTENALDFVFISDIIICL